MEKIKSSVRNYVKNKDVEIIIMILTAFFLSILSNTPYLALIFTPVAIFFLLWVEAIFILNIKARVSIIIGIFLLFLASFFLVFGSQKMSNFLGETAFVTLSLGAVVLFIENNF